LCRYADVIVSGLVKIVFLVMDKIITRKQIIVLGLAPSNVMCV